MTTGNKDLVDIIQNQKKGIQPKNTQKVVGNIKNEDEFRDAVTEAKKQKQSKSHSDIFKDIDTTIHTQLANQDSESMLTFITKSALSLGSSDIHYDNSESNIEIRVRIDGELETMSTLSKKEYKLVLERLKYKSDLKLNITTVPQDGKYRITDDGNKVDVRISTLPVRYGENVVCRILDSTKSIPSIDDLGFMWIAKHQIQKAIEKKNGTILVTGPTGSGKTTTLYSMLTELNKPEKKIITLEDPIEYELPGVAQSEIDEKDNYTYSTGLKALMRQDPDIIMIGEIRDLESATIAMQAAMTGHLVLSTLHTKSSSETVERLMNMGVANYILASGIDVIIAQRLVRRLCPHCQESYEASPDEVDIIKYMLKDIGISGVMFKKKKYTLHKSKGCKECGMTGYQGRIGIFEVMTFGADIRKAIREGKSPKEIIEIARKGDLILMREDGILKAMQGKTSLEELFKILD
ncbi:hypothetical protein CSB09_01800 [Candidatus Gracilibacteria bacterium]|nr:MAG: hypothetical protein CSB09_01800 [Candidatus Gracilibacteria bacterium]